jgi:hypothetical protein
MQYSFLMKCNFFELLSREQRIEKLRRQIEEARQKIAEYERIREDMRERNLTDYKIRIVNFGIETQLLKLQWVNDLLKSELEENPESPSKARKGMGGRTKR